MLSCEASQVRPTTTERRVESTRRACSVCLIDTEEKRGGRDEESFALVEYYRPINYEEGGGSGSSTEGGQQIG